MTLDLAFLIFLAIVSAGLGYRFLAWLRATPEHPLDTWALAVPIGLGTLCLSVLGLAEVGWLTPPAIAGLLVIGLLVGGKGGVVGTLRCRPSRFDRDPSRLVFWLLLGLTLVGTLLTSLAPVTDGDALCYHLQVPKVFLARASAVFEPDLHETIYPLVTESLYAVGLAFRGPVSCRLIEWLLGLVFAANVAAIARPILGDRAGWAGLIALLVPAISNGMTAPLNDVALAAFGNAAIHAWTRWRNDSSIRTAIVAGVLMGLAIGVKYPGLVLGGLLGLGFLIVPRRVCSADHPDEIVKKARPAERTLRWLSHGLVFSLVALLIGGGWYLRAYIHTGNPVYPFFRQVFGGSGIDEVLDPIKRPMPVTLGNILTAIGPLTLQPDRFDSFSHQFGPMFLLFLPALLVSRPPRRIVAIVGLGYVFLALCLTQRQSMRFVLIAIGPLSVGVAWLVSNWSSRKSLPRRLLIGLFLMMMTFEASLAVVRARHGLNVVLGRESADSFLSRREPTFTVGRWMAENLPEDARIIGQDHRGFYLPRSYSMELAHRRRTGLGKHNESASEIIETLKSEGFTHLLLCPPVPENAVEFDPTLGRLLAPWLATTRPIYRQDLGDADGVIRRYAIYALEPSFEEARR
jgi:hypothetical protein